MAIILDDSESQDRRIKMLLETANLAGTLRNQREELELKRQEQDPRVQAGKMANMLYMMGNTDAAMKMFEFAKTGALPTQQPGVQLPSQQTRLVPNYMGGATLNQPQTGVVLPSASPISSGIAGTINSKGLATMKLGGKPTIDPMTDANVDIHKTLTTEKLKKEQENQQGAEKTLSGTARYLKQLERSEAELVAKYPDIGTQGIGGWFERKGASVDNAFDGLPETQALQAMAEPFAQQIATDIEGRATDQDRKVQANNFANFLKKPSASNARVVSNGLLMLKDKGADITKVVKQLADSKSKTLKMVVDQIYEDAPELKPKDNNIDSLFEGL